MASSLAVDTFMLWQTVRESRRKYGCRYRGDMSVCHCKTLRTLTRKASMLVWLKSVHAEYISAALNTMVMGESMQLFWISYLILTYFPAH